MRSTIDESAWNAEAVRGGFAYVRQTMPSTKNYHAIADQQRRRYYLCDCGKPFLQGGHSNLARKRRTYDRWADDAQYKIRALSRSSKGVAR